MNTEVMGVKERLANLPRIALCYDTLQRCLHGFPAPSNHGGHRETGSRHLKRSPYVRTA